MKQQQTIIVSAIALLVGLGGGYMYGATQANVTQASDRGQFANLTPEERQARMAEFGGARGGGRVGRISAGDGIATGEVISQNDQGVTVQLRDGGSKIVFIGSSSMITKTASATPADIVVGAQVMIIGKTNPDGSFTAENVQIRPEGWVGGQPK